VDAFCVVSSGCPQEEVPRNPQTAKGALVAGLGSSPGGSAAPSGAAPTLRLGRSIGGGRADCGIG
jgi:hypothetical protein